MLLNAPTDNVAHKPSNTKPNASPYRRGHPFSYSYYSAADYTLSLFAHEKSHGRSNNQSYDEWTHLAPDRKSAYDEANQIRANSPSHAIPNESPDRRPNLESHSKLVDNGTVRALFGYE